MELVDDSVATGCLWPARSAIRRRAAAARSASRRRVALSSSPGRSRGVWSFSRDRGRNAGVSSSSSSASSCRPMRWVENLPNFLNRGTLRVSSTSESDSVELELRSSSSRVGDRMKEVVCGCSRLVTDGRRTKFSHRCSLPSVGVSLREESREW
jgi:hypothetical protein